MIKNKYEELSRKYRLPRFEELNEEFEISTIEHEDFLIREVRRKIWERIDYVVDTLNNILQPSPESLTGMTEYHFFSESEREELSKLFRDMMSLKRMAEAAGFDNDEGQAIAISGAFERWKQNKGRIRIMFSRMAESWPKEESIHAEVDYMR